MKQYGLNKYDKLCSPTAIDMLFSRGADSTQPFQPKSAMAYPLRAVWRENENRSSGSAVQFLISISKKRLRHAVDRVKMRRRVREAYRLNKATYAVVDGDKKIDLAFIYVANDIKDYQSIEKAVVKILHKINDDKRTEQSNSMAD